MFIEIMAAAKSNFFIKFIKTSPSKIKIDSQIKENTEFLKEILTPKCRIGSDVDLFKKMKGIAHQIGKSPSIPISIFHGIPKLK